MDRKIILTKKQKDALIEHAKKGMPAESCALLFGRDESGTCTVLELFLAKNVEDSPVRFTISGEDLLRGYQEAERKNLEVVGIFHSHPNSDAVPSATDRKFMEVNPYVWVISGSDFEFRAYILESGVSPVEVKIT